jgi:hypothetical protein
VRPSLTDVSVVVLVFPFPVVTPATFRYCEHDPLVIVPVCEEFSSLRLLGTVLEEVEADEIVFFTSVVTYSLF